MVHCCCLPFRFYGSTFSCLPLSGALSVSLESLSQPFSSDHLLLPLGQLRVFPEWHLFSAPHVIFSPPSCPGYYFLLYYLFYVTDLKTMLNSNAKLRKAVQQVSYIRKTDIYLKCGPQHFKQPGGKGLSCIRQPFCVYTILMVSQPDSPMIQGSQLIELIHIALSEE